jgi:hypothetical protein
MDMVRDMHEVSLTKGGQEFNTHLVVNRQLKVREERHGKGIEIMKRRTW